MKKKYFIIILFFITSISFSQNLVPNPKFEEYTDFPTDDSMLYLLKHWKNPTKGTPDFWVFSKKIKKNETLCNNEETNGCVGIGIRPEYSMLWTSDNSNWPEYYEYVQVKLNMELEKDKEYVIKCDVYFSHKGVYALDYLGAVLLNDSMHVEIKKRLKMPFVKLSNYGEILDDQNWVNICGCYKAKGGEKFLILGGFATKDEFIVGKHLTYGEGMYFAYYSKEYKIYYYLDNISVEKLNSKNSCKKFVLSKKILKVGQTIKLENIFFETDKSVLLKESYKELNELLKIMNQNPKMKIEISGHTDNTGSETHNKELSEARAKAVYDFLISKGIKEERITYKGYGYSKPIAKNSTDEGRQKNRRVEFKIIEK
ncbi:MAG: OmpA family protein [Bacteroidales bacterium]|nr:OmpA family protein [Bacteroidales bacterium]